MPGKPAHPPTRMVHKHLHLWYSCIQITQPMIYLCTKIYINVQLYIIAQTRDIPTYKELYTVTKTHVSCIHVQLYTITSTHGSFSHNHLHVCIAEHIHGHVQLYTTTHTHGLLTDKYQHQCAAVYKCPHLWHTSPQGVTSILQCIQVTTLTKMLSLYKSFYLYITESWVWVFVCRWTMGTTVYLHPHPLYTLMEAPTSMYGCFCHPLPLPSYTYTQAPTTIYSCKKPPTPMVQLYATTFISVQQNTSSE